MYRLKISVPTLPTPLLIANEDIHAYYISVHVVNGLQGNERKMFLLTESVLAGMTNPTGVGDGDELRVSFRCSPRGLFAYSEDRLGPLPAIAGEHEVRKDESTWRRMFEKYTKGRYPDGVNANFPAPRSPHVGLLVTLWAYIRHAKIDDDDPPVSLGSKVGKHRQKEIAQAFLPAHEIALVGDRATIEIPWEGNDSGVLSVLTNRVEVLMHADEELENFGEAFGGDASRAQPNLRVHVKCMAKDPSQEEWRRIQRAYRESLDTHMPELRKTHMELERAYLGEFEPFRATRDLTTAQMRNRKWERLAPLTGDMTTFHVIRYQTYQLGRYRGRVDDDGHNSLWLPIWAYSWPYQLKDCRRGPLNPAIRDHIQAFLQNVFRQTCTVYSLRPEEVATALAPFTPEGQEKGRVDWSQLGPARSVVLDMLALGDFASHYLTAPAFKAAYTSDYRYGPMRDPVTGEIRMGRLNTESQDLGLVCSQCGSDDCEGCEQGTLKMYGLLTHPSDGGLTSAMDGVRYLSHYLLTHFEYIGTAISTTSAYPGDVSVDDVLDVVVGIDHVHLVKQHILGDEGRCTSPNKCKKDRVVLKNMQYGSQFDQELRNTFHQNSLLIPCIEMYRLLDLDGEDRTDRRLPEEVKRAQRQYYKERARASARVLKRAARHLGLLDVKGANETDQIMKMAPVAINMESTHPVSTFLVGPSTQILNRFPTTKGLDSWTLALLTEDWQCARDAGPMRTRIFNVFDEARPRELHSLRTLPGYPMPKKGKEGWELCPVPEFSAPHYGSTFYHLLCHGLNSTMMRASLVEPETGPLGGLTAQEIGALSHMTFCANGRNLFGVPLESFLYETCNSSDRGHRVQHPFSMVPMKTLQKYDRLLEEVDAAARIAPIHFGRNEGMTVRPPAPVVLLPPSTRTGIDAYFDKSIASRILRTRYVALDGVRAEERNRIDAIKHVLVNDVMGKEAVEAVETAFTLSGKMFTVFGEESTGLVCLRKPARMDSRQ